MKNDLQRVLRCQSQLRIASSEWETFPKGTTYSLLLASMPDTQEPNDHSLLQM